MTHIGLILVSTLLLVSYGEGLRCYTCSSDVNHHCGDPFENQGNLNAQDCNRNRSPSPYSAEHVACRKIVKNVNNEKVVVRACSWVYSKDEEHCSNNSRDMISCDTCDTDLCNGTSGLTASVALVLSIITAKYLA